MSAEVVPSYPATFQFDPPATIARWRPLVQWLLVIPHAIVSYFLTMVAEVLALVGWILGVITGKIPEGILTFIALSIRYNVRVSTYALFLKQEYPPFSFDTTLADPGDDPRVRVDFARETEGRNRLTIFFRGLLALPHIIALLFVSLVFSVVLIIAFFAVLITGRWPAGLRSFAIGLQRWSTRLNAYLFLLTDEYPPFGFK
jgi:hypothetical protein